MFLNRDVQVLEEKLQCQKRTCEKQESQIAQLKEALNRLTTRNKELVLLATTKTDQEQMVQTLSDKVSLLTKTLKKERSHFAQINANVKLKEEECKVLRNTLTYVTTFLTVI